MSVDLTTTYLGFQLRNPLVVASCPATGKLDSLRRLEDAGASAVVLPSLFEEQVAHEILTWHRMHPFGSQGVPAAMTYFPEMDDYNTGHDRYLGLIEKAKKALTIPVIASLNGQSDGGWVYSAQKVQEAGADAIELNIYMIPTDSEETGAHVEARHIELIKAVRGVVAIPLAVKVGPFFSSVPNMARQMVQAGANGLVLFNRFLQPELSLETYEETFRLTLSHHDELRLPLRWVTILRPQLDVSLAATGGVQTYEDVIKLLMVGVDAAQTASAVLRHGPDYLGTMLNAIRSWMQQKGVSTLAELRNLRKTLPDADANPGLVERMNYLRIVASATDNPDFTR